MPRRITTIMLALVAGMAFTACTADTPAPESPTPGATQAGAVPTTGWWCAYIDKSIVKAATGGRADQAREVVLRNDGQVYQCQVQVPTAAGGTEVALSLEVEADNETAIAAARQKASAAAGVKPGPPYLGESYVSPGLVVSILPCGPLAGAATPQPQVPWLISLSAPLPGGQTLTDQLIPPVGRYLVYLDQNVKCNPSQATTPADDSSATTGG